MFWSRSIIKSELSIKFSQNGIYDLEVFERLVGKVCALQTTCREIEELSAQSKSILSDDIVVKLKNIFSDIETTKNICDQMLKNYHKIIETGEVDDAIAVMMGANQLHLESALDAIIQKIRSS